MSSQTARTGKNFTAYEVGAQKQWPDHVVQLPGVELPGKQFLKDKLNLTGCEISVNSLKPGTSMPFYHTHQQNEEVYFFIQGKGQMQIDDEVLEVQEGTMVRIAPNGVRTWRNHSDGPLSYIVIQMKENSLNQYGLGDGEVPDRAVSWPN